MNYKLKGTADPAVTEIRQQDGAVLGRVRRDEFVYRYETAPDVWSDWSSTNPITAVNEALAYLDAQAQAATRLDRGVVAAAFAIHILKQGNGCGCGEDVPHDCKCNCGWVADAESSSHYMSWVAHVLSAAGTMQEART